MGSKFSMFGFDSDLANPAESSDNASYTAGNFTSELHTYFRYRGGERLDFLGDDDVCGKTLVSVEDLLDVLLCLSHPL